VSKPTLLIVAAGMGSRYGGLKQIDPVGPNGEVIIDYSMYDAIAAGFKKVVFVIRRSFEQAFRDKIGSKLDGRVETAYAYQELDAGLNGFPLPADREKPWGTGHAILVANEVVNEPFAVINADDYYGTESFKTMVEFLSGPELSTSQYAMVGYILRNTLSEHGHVARGICTCDGSMILWGVTERLGIVPTDQGACYKDEQGSEHPLTGGEVVSMNLWGFHPSIFDHLSTQFKTFLHTCGNQPKAEFFIPTVVDTLIKNDQARVKVLPTRDTWFGVTYKEDQAIAQRRILELIEAGIYPNHLWGDA
jgi:NDP-sugar pyrophosphorylase family protein